MTGISPAGSVGRAPQADARAAPAVVIVGGGNIVSGREIMMLALGRGLRAAGYRIVFITSLWSGQGDFLARLRADGFEFYRVRLGFISITLSLKPIWWTLDQLRYWPALVWGYLGAIKKAAPVAVIHTNWHHALLLLPFLNRRRDIYWSHEIIPASRHYGVVFRAIARRVRKMVCTSNAVARALEAHGIDPAKIAVVHNALLLDGVSQGPDTSFPLRLGLIGLIGEWKGHGDALEALALLRDSAAKVVLKIFGKGDPDYIAVLHEKATSLGIQDRLEWCGFVSDQKEIFQAIDVCLMPSRLAESFGLSALEAGMCGRPVICTDMGGLPEIVINGQTGLVVPPSRPDLLASAIETFIKRPDLIVAMGTAGRTRVEKEFSYSRFVDRFVDVIEAVG